MKAMPNLLLLAAIAVAAVLPAGCATNRVEVPREVKVEVPVPCVREVPKRPEIRSTEDLLRMPRGVRTILTWVDRLRLEAYARELEAVVAGCSKLPG